MALSYHFNLLTFFGFAATLILATGNECSFREDGPSELEDALRSKIAGQDAAVDMIVDKVRAWSHTAPLTLVFTGPTRVGKTLAANVVAHTLLPPFEKRGARRGFLQLAGTELASILEWGTNGPARSIDWLEQGKRIGKIVKQRLAETLDSCSNHAVVILDEMAPGTDGVELPAEYFAMFNFLHSMIDTMRHSFEYNGKMYDTSDTLFFFISPLTVAAMQQMLPAHESLANPAWLGEFKQRIVSRVRGLWGDVLKLDVRSNGIVPFYPLTALSARAVFQLHLRQALAVRSPTSMQVIIEPDVGILPDEAFPSSILRGPEESLIFKVAAPVGEAATLLADVGTSRIYLQYTEGKAANFRSHQCLSNDLIPYPDMLVAQGAESVKKAIPAQIREQLVLRPLYTKRKQIMKYLEDHITLKRGKTEYVGKIKKMEVEIRFTVTCRSKELQLSSEAHIRLLSMLEDSAWFTNTLLPHTNAFDYVMKLGFLSVALNAPPIPLIPALVPPPKCSFVDNPAKLVRERWEEYRGRYPLQYRQVINAVQQWDHGEALVIPLAGAYSTELRAMAGKIAQSFLPGKNNAPGIVMMNVAANSGDIAKATRAQLAAALSNCSGNSVVIFDSLVVTGAVTLAASMNFLASMLDTARGYFMFQGTKIKTEDSVFIFLLPFGYDSVMPAAMASTDVPTRLRFFEQEVATLSARLLDGPTTRSIVSEVVVLPLHERDVPLAVVPDKKPSPADVTDKKPSPADVTDKKPSPAVVADKKPSPTVVTDKKPSPAVVTDKKPSPAVVADKKPSPLLWQIKCQLPLLCQTRAQIKQAQSNNLLKTSTL